MKRFLYLFLFITLVWTTGNAQHEAHYTHFMYTKQLINPAYVGSSGMPSFMGLYRKQWIGFDGAPESQLLTFNAPFFDSRVGFGVAVSRQITGDFEEYFGNLSYSYDMINQDDLNLRIGIMGTLKYLGLNINGPGSAIRNPSDPVASLISGDDFSKVGGNVGAGLYLNIKDAYIGLSVPNIITRQLGTDVSQRPAEENPHFYGMAGAIIPIPESSFSIYPNVLFKYVENAPFSLDINLSAIYNNVFTFGASYRYGEVNGDSVDFLARYQVSPAFGLGVAYDLPISDIRDYNSGSIELMMSYNIGGKGKNGDPDMTNPRFFF
ncbi:MAG: PorP/SprF family type IX secretion system membrane protein [Saprospiraceae bacterium]